MRGKGLRVPLKIENFENNFFLVHGAGIRLKCREKVSFSLKYCFRMKFKANSACLHFSPKPLLKKPIKTRSSLIWSHSQKHKICVTDRISKINISLQLSLRSRHSRIFAKSSCPQKQPSRCIFNIATLHLWINYLKNTCDGVRFLLNLHLTLSSFEPLLRNFKYFIIALIN